MKRIYSAMRVAMMVACVALLGSCSEETIYNYLNVSDNSFSLDGKGEGEFTITIDASSDWNATIGDSWIVEVERDETSITVKGEPYAGATPRYGSITIKSGEQTRKITVSQTIHSTSVMLNDLFYYGVVSPDGNYVAGNVVVSDGVVMPVTIDTRTGEVRKFTCKLPEEIVVPERETAYGVDWEVHVVDNNGNIFMNNPYLIFGLRIDAATNTYSLIEVPDGSVGGCVTGVSGDGSVWVGSYCPVSGGWFPMKWVNGVPEPLEITEVNGTGKEKIWYGAVARGCSDDGSIIYGSIMDYDEAIWWDKEGKMRFVAPELLEHTEEVVNGELVYQLTGGARIYADPQRVSPNGKWISFKCSGSNSPAGCGYIDTETGIPTYVKASDILTITNDKDLVQHGYVTTADGEQIPAMDWIKQKYGVTIGDTRYITQVAANGNIFGWKQSGDYYLSWWLDRE